jgi:hypothetical protein
MATLSGLSGSTLLEQFYKSVLEFIMTISLSLSLFLFLFLLFFLLVLLLLLFF